LLRKINDMARIVAISVTIGALTGCSLLPKEESQLKPPLIKPAQENYRTVQVARGTVAKQIDSRGYLESVALDTVQFTGENGRIGSITVKSGDKVRKGDVLVKLITDDLGIQLKEQELALLKAKLAYRQAKGTDAEALQVASLQTEIEQMKYDQLSKQYDSKLLKSGIDGQVIFVEALKEGDPIEPYQTLVTVADPTKLRVSLQVENTDDIREVDIGMAAKITLNGKEVDGKVVQTPSSAPQTLNKNLADRYAKTLYIESAALAKDAEIGASADVVIILAQRENVLKIPKGALRSYSGRTFVRILEDGNRIREADVEAGLSSPTEVEIIKGLTEGQKVILQ